MPEISQFGGAEGRSPSRDCLHTEAMLADVLDNALSAEEQARFDEHLATCADCAALLADARRGASWLKMLQPHPPEPPRDLVARILAGTSVRAAAEAASAEQAHRAAISGASLLGMPPTLQIATATESGPATTAEDQPAISGRLLPFRARVPGRIAPTLGAMLQTRMAMTAAMAFFSIALTFNLLGVHVTALRARDLTPSSLRRSASEANAHVVRYYESLRVVYELESRVHDLQHGTDSDIDPRRTSQAPAEGNDDSRPANTSPSDDTAKPGAPAAKPAPQASPREPRSSSNPGIRGQHDTNAEAHHSMQNAVPLGPTLPVVFHGQAYRLKKGALA